MSALLSDPHGIRTRREMLGWNERELARRAGVPYQRVQSLERPTATGDAPNSRYLPPIEAVLQAALEGHPAPMPKSPLAVGTPDAVHVYRVEQLDDGKGYQRTNIALELVTRPASVASIEGIYALQIRSRSMSPVYKPGDVIVVNPFGVPRPEVGVVLTGGVGRPIEVAEFIEETETDWIVKKYGPTVERVSLSRVDFPECHTIVAVYPVK